MKLQHFYYSCCAAAALLAFFIFVCAIRPAKAQEAAPVIPEKGILETITDLWKWDTDEQLIYVKKENVHLSQSIISCGATIMQGKQYITNVQAKKLVEKDLYNRKESEILASLKVYKIETLKAVVK